VKDDRETLDDSRFTELDSDLHVIRVPVLPPQERLEFILEKLVERRLFVLA
jgi:hypothetical protein